MRPSPVGVAEIRKHFRAEVLVISQRPRKHQAALSGAFRGGVNEIARRAASPKTAQVPEKHRKCAFK